MAQIEEIQLYVRDSSGNRTNVTLPQLVEKANGAPVSRADLNISRSLDGELLITSDRTARSVCSFRIPLRHHLRGSDNMAPR